MTRFLSSSAICLGFVLSFQAPAKEPDPAKDDANDRPLAGSIFGRKGPIREKLLREGGGTRESEAAVMRGLQWLARHQHDDGRWRLDDDRFPERGQRNDAAATAFGLLPLLGCGCTHQEAK